MLHRVISGGQTGVDLAGLRAAKACRIQTGGWAPKGYLTEKGPRIALLRDVYGLEEHSSSQYPPRTMANVKNSDLTLLIADELDRGSGLTRKFCFDQRKPVFHISVYDLTSERRKLEVFNWLCLCDPKTINVAGNRESKSPGIEQLTVPFLRTLFDWFNKPKW